GARGRSGCRLVETNGYFFCPAGRGETGSQTPGKWVPSSATPTRLVKNLGSPGGDVEIVVDPEEILLGFRVPADREGFIPEELAEDLLLSPHGQSSQPLGMLVAPPEPVGHR